LKHPTRNKCVDWFAQIMSLKCELEIGVKLTTIWAIVQPLMLELIIVALR
jgi:hypothetical protein